MVQKPISLLCVLLFLTIFISTNCTRKKSGEIESNWDLFDYDGDGITNGQDLDDDNDGILDMDEEGNPLDQCRRGDLNWISYTQAQVDADAEDDITEVTDMDSDGCKDNSEDADDDGDLMCDSTEIGQGCTLYNDKADNCPTVPNPNQENNYGSEDFGDVCEDTDQDNILDNIDRCAESNIKWTSNLITDVDSDGCKDDTEDADDDGDLICDSTEIGQGCTLYNDKADNCPTVPNPRQENNYGSEDHGDACEDIDGDGTVDIDDAYPSNTCASTNTDRDKFPDELLAIGTRASGGEICTAVLHEQLVEDADDDGDLICDSIEIGQGCTLYNGRPDNCQFMRNRYQTDTDGDGIGDACDDGDSDGDGVFDIDEVLGCGLKLDCDADGKNDDIDVDADGDGLIDIYSIEMLHNIRHNLSGSSLDGNSTGCGGTDDIEGNAITSCNGYELVRDLDFDINENGHTFYDSNIHNDENDCAVAQASNGIDITENSCMIDAGDSTDFFVNTEYTDSSNQGWQPIGDVSKEFNTIFEGNEYEIRNLFIKTDEGYGGLFGVIGDDAYIRNLKLIDGLVISFHSYSPSASLVGWNMGNIHNSHTSVHVFSRSASGGLVGKNNENIINSSASGAVYSDSYSGGLVGYNYRGNIENSSASGSVYSDSYSGGLVGYNYEGTIENSHASVHIFSSRSASGGLVGWNNGSIEYSYASGDVDSSTIAGGLVGSILGGMIEDSYASGSVSSFATAIATAGGLVGYNYRSRISNSYGTGTVSSSSFSSASTSYAGGLLGHNKEGRVENSYATGDVSSFPSFYSSSFYSYSGGLVGYSEGGTIENSYAIGNTSSYSYSNASYSGGLVGLNYDSTMTNVYRNADANAQGITINSHGIPLTLVQFRATSGIYANALALPWVIVEGNYPGLCLGNALHRPSVGDVTITEVLPKCK